MDDNAIDVMIHDLLEMIDHDIAKEYNKETSEEPEFIESKLEDLRSIIRNFEG